MGSAVDDLWSLARDRVHVDANALARAVEDAAEGGADALDYRTRLLIRDGLAALGGHWGSERFQAWLARSARGAQLRGLCEDAAMRAASGDEGFPTLARRIMNPVAPQTVMQLLRELSSHVTQPTHLIIGGSVALLLSGLLARHTDDIDVVDELPASMRDQPQLLDELARRYGLRLGEFESRYLPEGWTQRIRSIDALGNLLVFAIDPYDVFIGKLFSTRDKDRDDLRAIAPLLEWHLVLDRLRRTTTTLRADARLHEAAKQNWFILFGEDLPA